MKSVNIYMVTYHSLEIIVKTINRLHEVTKYPFRLIVGDNLSEKSDEIRLTLKNMVDQGKIDMLFMYDDNYLASITKHMIIKDSIKSDIIIITDQDAYISKDNNECWLNDYVEAFNNDKKVMMIQYHALNGNLSMNGVGYKKTDKKFCVSNVKTKEKCQSNGHYMALKKEYLESFFKDNPNKPTVDGYLITYIDTLRGKDNIDYTKLRYDNNSVINLSSESCGVSNLTDIKKDDKYLNERVQLVGGRTFNGKNFLKLYPINKYEVYENKIYR